MPFKCNLQRYSVEGSESHQLGESVAKLESDLVAAFEAGRLYKL